MKTNEPKREMELLPTEVKKGDEITIVKAYNFFREVSRKNGQVDQYLVERWTVAAIGKKLMRCTNETGNLKENVYLMTRCYGQPESFTGFQNFITRPENASAMVEELFQTDSKSTETLADTIYR